MAWVTRGNLKGPTGTIDAASAGALPAGASPVVVLSGTPAHRTLTFGIPKGDKGDQGPPGFESVPTDAGVAQLVNLPSATRAALAAKFDPLDVPRLDRSATRGYVDSAFLRMDSNTINVVAGASGSVTFGGLPALPVYSFGSPITVTLTLRDNAAGARGIAELPVAVSREAGTCALQVGNLTNLRETQFSTTTGNAVVSATISTDGTRLTVNVQNNRANITRYQVQIGYHSPRYAPSTFYAWGDSLTAGGLNTYPNYLSQKLSRPVINMGIGGEKSQHIAARAQVIVTTLTSGVTIPTSGAVNIVTSTGIATDQQIFGLNVSIGGIDGLLNRSGTNTAFTRTKAGYSLSLPAGTPVVFTDADAAKDSTQVFWAGSNDVDTLFSQTMSNVMAMVQASRTGKVVALGPLVNSNYPSGTPQHTAAVNLSATMSATFGAQFLDIRRYLIDNGLAAAGITPTAQDNTDIANDVVPSSLRFDIIHLTDVGYNLVATQVQAKLVALGYDA